MKTKIQFHLLFAITLIGVSFFATQIAQAQTRYSYNMLESLPGFYQAGAEMTNLPNLILSIYKFGIWIVGITGLFMLVIGGIMYMISAGNNASINNAKDIIWDSIFGVIAALCAYLFLYIINPDFTQINLDSIVPVQVSEPTVLKSEYVPLPGQLSDAEAKRRLSAAGIGVSSNVCAKVTDSNCTILEGIPAKAVSGLIAMKKACPGCNFFVTGGTEAGHASHGPGNPVMDVRYDQDVKNFLTTLKSSRTYANFSISQVCTQQADLQSISYNRSYTNLCPDPSTTPHFHLNFGA